MNNDEEKKFHFVYLLLIKMRYGIPVLIYKEKIHTKIFFKENHITLNEGTIIGGSSNKACLIFSFVQGLLGFFEYISLI
jgi:hypothetical protein